MNEKIMKILAAMIIELDNSKIKSITLTKREGKWDLQIPVDEPSWNADRQKKIPFSPTEPLGPLGPVGERLIEAIKEVKHESNIIVEDVSSIYDLVIEGVPLCITPRLRGNRIMGRPIDKLTKGSFLSIFNGKNWDTVITPKEIKAIGEILGFEIGIRHIYSNRAKHVRKMKEKYV